MSSKIKQKLTSRVFPLALIGGCLGTCKLIDRLLPEPRKTQVDLELRKEEFRGAKARIYKDKLNPNKEYIDFEPFGNMDLVIYSNSKGRRIAYDWFYRKPQDVPDFLKLQEEAVNKGLIERPQR